MATDSDICGHVVVINGHLARIVLEVNGFVTSFVGGVAQWENVGLWPANFPCPALDLQLMGDHYCG